MAEHVRIKLDDDTYSRRIGMDDLSQGRYPDGQMVCPECGRATMHFRAVSIADGGQVKRAAHVATNPGQKHESHCSVPHQEALYKNRQTLEAAIRQDKIISINLNGDGLVRETDHVIKHNKKEEMAQLFGLKRAVTTDDYINIPVKKTDDFQNILSIVNDLEYEFERSARVMINHLGQAFQREDIIVKSDNLMSVQNALTNIMQRTRSPKRPKNNAKPSDNVPLLFKGLSFSGRPDIFDAGDMPSKTVLMRDRGILSDDFVWETPVFDVQHFGLPFKIDNRRTGAPTRHLPWQGIRFLVRSQDCDVNTYMWHNQKRGGTIDVMAYMDERAVRAVIYEGVFKNYRAQKGGVLEIELNVGNADQMHLKSSHARHMSPSLNHP